MFDRDDLRAAVAANVLNARQAAQLEAFILTRKLAPSGQDMPAGTGQEDLRFLSNFNDIFITLGLIILFAGVTALVGTFFGPAATSGNALVGTMAAIPVAALAWLMLEYFCARRRMLLPSMALAIIFTTFGAVALTSLIASVMRLDLDAAGFGVFQAAGHLGKVAFAAAALSAGGVYWRFRLPFSLALIALALSGLFYVSLGFGGNLGYVIGGSLSLMLGIATMLAAVLYDIKDPERIRKASDNAFWLHLAAAPQIIIGVSTVVTGSNLFSGSTSGTDNASQALALLVVLVALAFIALALNRRALIAASILTFMFTLSFVLGKAGLNVSAIFMIVAIVIGGGVVLLGAGWKTARRAVLVLFPRGGLWSRLFPPETP